jgi:DNA-3-methyladenine glycosylase I
MSATFSRCNWCGSDPLYITYHDNEWGVPLHDDSLLFEFLILEGFQAGLSWLTILKKREAFRKAFNGFNAYEIIRFDQSKIEHLMQNSTIIRNRAKILATVQNARCFLEIKEQFGSFDRYIWQFVEGRPMVNSWKSEDQIPTKTVESEKMSRDMRSKGFKFVGPTICYAFMQATGLVNDHITTCFRYSEVDDS